MQAKGFTIVELMVVIGILVIVAAISIPLYGNWQIESQAESAKNSILQLLRLAQAHSQTGFHDSKHGIYINDTEKQAIYFEGENYSSRASEHDRVVAYSDLVIVSSTLSGDEIGFSKGAGRPIATGTISITETHSGSLYTITINEAGLIE